APLRADSRQRLAPGRPAARQGSHRHGQSDAGCVPRRRARSAVSAERAVRQHHDAKAGRRAAAADRGARHGRAAAALGLHLRAGGRGDSRRTPDALHRVPVYRAAVENVASEMAARMVAMKAASDNAGKLITELQLIYNKARQAAITKELSEIVGGAAAV